MPLTPSSWQLLLTGGRVYKLSLLIFSLYKCPAVVVALRLIRSSPADKRYKCSAQLLAGVPRSLTGIYDRTQRSLAYLASLFRALHQRQLFHQLRLLPPISCGLARLRRVPRDCWNDAANLSTPSRESRSRLFGVRS